MVALMHGIITDIVGSGNNGLCFVVDSLVGDIMWQLA
jgi:hypothetical protein